MNVKIVKCVSKQSLVAFLDFKLMKDYSTMKGPCLHR